MGDTPKLILDFLDFPPFWITFKLLYCNFSLPLFRMKVELLLSLPLHTHSKVRKFGPFNFPAGLAVSNYFLDERAEYFENLVTNRDLSVMADYDGDRL